MRSYWRKVWAVARKDLLIELRSRDVLSSAVVFTLLVLLDLQLRDRSDRRCGACRRPRHPLGHLHLRRDADASGGPSRANASAARCKGCCSRRSTGAALFVAKLLVNLILLGVVEVFALPAFVALYNLTVRPGALLAVVALGTLGFAGVGTLFAAVAANTRAREALLPLLLFPVLVPVIIGAVKATGESLPGASAAGPPWLGLLVAFDAIFLALGYVMFEYVIEE